MGSGPGKTPNATFYTHPSYVDGRYGEVGDVYIARNDCARFSSIGFEHEFIVMDNEQWPAYKIYEWTIKNFMAYECRSIKFRKTKYLGLYKVSVVYKAALEASRGREFNSFTFNCKDWVKIVQNKLYGRDYNPNYVLVCGNQIYYPL